MLYSLLSKIIDLFLIKLALELLVLEKVRKKRGYFAPIHTNHKVILILLMLCKETQTPG